MKAVSRTVLVTLFASGTALATEIEFDEYDRDGDDYLSRTEWAAIDQVVTDFDQADRNGDGQLDRDEVRNAIQHSMEVAGTEGATLQTTAQDDGSQSENEDAANNREQAGRTQQEADTFDDREAVRTSPVEESATERTSGRQATGEPVNVEQDGEQDEGERDGYLVRSAAEPDVRPVRDGFDAGGEGLQAFDEADTDGDGRINESEARLAGHDYVAIYFDEMDVDGDGYLHESEWDLTRRVGLEGDDNTPQTELITHGDDGEDLGDNRTQRQEDDEESAAEDDREW